MKTILIPVDFSTVCNNAINFAVALVNESKAERIVLLKSFYISIYAELLPSADFVQLNADDIREERGKAIAQLKQLQENIQSQVSASVKVDTALSESPLLRAVHEAIAEIKPDLLVLGSNSSELDEGYIAGELVSIAKSSPVPVLVVPADAAYRSIKNVLVPVELKTASGLALLDGLKLIAPNEQPQLLLLDIDENSREHQEELNKAIADLMVGYRYEVYQANERNKIHAILSFARENNLDLIAALPGKNSFFYNLTHRNITEALALNAKRPVLILK